MFKTISIVAVSLFICTQARAEESVDDVLKKYDAIMGPDTFDSEMVMTATREDGTKRIYDMRAIKSGNDKFRIWFTKPASIAGQEMLRVGDNSWLYIPSLRRATRVANRDSFQGGDFNNADVLRVNYQSDYNAKFLPSESKETVKLELKAKSENTSYEQILLWLRKSDTMPVKGEYYGTSGKLLRSAEFSDYKEFEKGYRRPAKVLMKNEIVKARQSELEIRTMKTGMSFAAQKFTQADLGK